MSHLATVAPPVSAPSSVRIASAPGTIWISSQDLLSECDESTYRRFIKRVLTVDAVRSVAVDRTVGDIVVRYDQRALRQGDAMTRISSALHRASDSQAGAVNLDLIAGTVTRVDRRPWGGGMMTTIVSQGSDFLSACARVVRRQPIDPKPVADPKPAVHPAEKVIVTQGLEIHFVPQLLDPELRISRQISRGPASTTLRPAVPVAQGLKRYLHLTAASGCFVMSFVGLVTPGIPTVPFVLATSYFLVRSSPTLNERLRQSRLFGQMVRDWEERGGLRRSTKRRILLFTFAIMGVTLVVAELTLPLVLLIGVMGSLGVVLVNLLPTVVVEENDPPRIGP